MKPRDLSLAVLAALAVAGCDAGIGNTGRIQVQLTDAPADDVASAEVWISGVELVGGSGGPIGISSEEQNYDLLDLTDGVTAIIGDATVPSGDYEQLRLIVDSARVTLVSGKTFADGSTSRTLVTPSAQQSGIKVNFGGPVHIASGETIIVVDFDVSRNFVFTGAAGNPTGVLFKPVLHATARDVAGSIAGTVTPNNSRARVYAIMGTDTVTSALADSVTGTYKLWYLPPGDYTVAAKATGFQVSTQTTTVSEGENVTGLNFTLTP